jgi:hypothetical protein
MDDEKIKAVWNDAVQEMIKNHEKNDKMIYENHEKNDKMIFDMAYFIGYLQSALKLNSETDPLAIVVNLQKKDKGI